MNLKANKQTDERKVFDVVAIEIAEGDPFAIDMAKIRAATGLSDTTIVKALNFLDAEKKIVMNLALDSIDGMNR